MCAAVPEVVDCTSCGAPLPAHAPSPLCAVCLIRAALSPESHLEPGDRVAGYEILEGPFAGGMGRVYRARKVGAPDALQVALKIMSVEQLESRERRALFQQEIEALAKLRHPGIVRIYDTGEHEGQLFFTMEFVEGGTLADRFERFATPEPAARLLQRVARAVDYGHGEDRRLLHLDLTPANILIDTSDRPVIVDFGVSSLLGTSVRHGGTPEYMAPEQVPQDGRPLSAACDVYALGAILYHLLSRRPPFQARTVAELRAQIARKQPKPLHDVAPGVDADLAAICHRCLELAPEARYPSAADLADDLARWLRREPVEARPGPSWRRTQHFVRRHPFLCATAASTLVALLALGTALGESVRQLREDLVATTLRANAHTAGHAAGNALRVLGEYAERLRGIASEDRFRTAVTDARTSDEALAPYLRGAFDSIGFYTTDGERTLRWPVIASTAYPRDFPWRDYFRGARAEASRGCDDVYVGRSIRSESDHKHKILLSVPVCARDHWLGVLMATLDSSTTIGTMALGDARAEGARGALLGLRDRSREEIGAPPPEEYHVLVHEGLRQGETARIDAEVGARLHAAWGPPREAGAQLAPRPDWTNLTDGEYRDPVPGFAGRWLAGIAPVGGTGLVVVVQTRYDQVIAPGNAMTTRVLGLMLGVAGSLSLLVAALVLTARIRRRSRSAPS